MVALNSSDIIFYLSNIEKNGVTELILSYWIGYLFNIIL